MSICIVGLVHVVAEGVLLVELVRRRHVLGRGYRRHTWFCFWSGWLGDGTANGKRHGWRGWQLVSESDDGLVVC